MNAKEKARSLPDGVIGNSIKCLHSAVKKTSLSRSLSSSVNESLPVLARYRYDLSREGEWTRAMYVTRPLCEREILAKVVLDF